MDGAALCGRARGQGHEKLLLGRMAALPGFMIVAYYKHNHLSARSSLGAPPASQCFPRKLTRRQGGRHPMTAALGAIT